MEDEDEVPGSFGVWLKEHREAAGLTQIALSQKAGVSNVQICNIEIGRTKNPRQATRERLERALGKTVPAEIVLEIANESNFGGFGEVFDFDPNDEEDWPDKAGVYILYDRLDRPVYVGQTMDGARRLSEHYEKFWFKAPVVVTGIFVPMEDAAQRRDLETFIFRVLKKFTLITKRAG